VTAVENSGLVMYSENSSIASARDLISDFEIGDLTNTSRK
jgi:hypothetical protein